MTENLPGMSIPEFYAGKNVFITGGTGFMGKVLIEKLLRSIPDVGSIYILIRPKRNKTIEDRKKDLLSSMVSPVMCYTVLCFAVCVCVCVCVRACVCVCVCVCTVLHAKLSDSNFLSIKPSRPNSKQYTHKSASFNDSVRIWTQICMQNNV